MEMEKSKVLMQFHLIFRQSWDVLSFLYARRLRGYTATGTPSNCFYKCTANKYCFANFATFRYQKKTIQKLSSTRNLLLSRPT